MCIEVRKSTKVLKLIKMNVMKVSFKTKTHVK